MFALLPTVTLVFLVVGVEDLSQLTGWTAQEHDDSSIAACLPLSSMIVSTESRHLAIRDFDSEAVPLRSWQCSWGSEECGAGARTDVRSRTHWKKLCRPSCEASPHGS